MHRVQVFELEHDKQLLGQFRLQVFEVVFKVDPYGQVKH
jgi:hypothetical protein